MHGRLDRGPRVSGSKRAPNRHQRQRLRVASNIWTPRHPAIFPPGTAAAFLVPAYKLLAEATLALFCLCPGEGEREKDSLDTCIYHAGLIPLHISAKLQSTLPA